MYSTNYCWIFITIFFCTIHTYITRKEERRKKKVWMNGPEKKVIFCTNWALHTNTLKKQRREVKFEGNELFEAPKVFCIRASRSFQLSCVINFSKALRLSITKWELFEWKWTNSSQNLLFIICKMDHTHTKTYSLYKVIRNCESLCNIYIFWHWKNVLLLLMNFFYCYRLGNIKAFLSLARC